MEKPTSSIPYLRASCLRTSVSSKGTSGTTKPESIDMNIYVHQISYKFTHKRNTIKYDFTI